MKVTVNFLGTEVKLKQEVFLPSPSLALQDVLRAIREKFKGQLERFIRDDLSPLEGCAVLVNGRNILSLDSAKTEIRDGDEVTFTVLVAGG